jgi:DegV family protein with EDD domain
MSNSDQAEPTAATDAPVLTEANDEQSDHYRAQGPDRAPNKGSDATPEHVTIVAKAYNKRRSCKIIVDSSSDLAPEVIKRLGVEVIPYHYVGPQGERVDDLWENGDPHEFYEFMRKNPDARFTTMAITPGTYAEVFEGALGDGLPILYLCLSEGLSSSINSARQAANMVQASHAGAEIYILDNKCDSAAGELLLMEVCRQAAAGLTAREVYEWAQDARYFIHGYFTLDSLHWLALGGRIPPAAAQVGAKLDVKPELSYDINGSLTLRGMYRGRKKAMRAIIQDFHDNYAHDTSLPLAIVSSDANKDADWLEAQVRKEKGCEDLAVIRSSVSPILGSHVGPGMVALVFWGTDRREQLSLTDRIAHRIRDGRSVSRS